MSELTPDDESLLDRARRGLEPTPADRARGKARLMATIGVGVGAAAGASTVATSAGAGTALVAGAGATSGTVSLLMKILVVVAVAGGLAGTTVAVVRSPRESRAIPTDAVASPVVQAEPPPPPLAPAGDPASTAAPLARPPITLPAPTLASPSPRTFVRAPASKPAERATKAEPSPPVPLSTPPAAGPASVAAEAELLREADEAVKAGDPTRALALLDRHAASYPNAILTEEREAERVVVLCALGRSAEARAAGAAFLASHPRSPMTARVRASCGAL